MLEAEKSLEDALMQREFEESSHGLSDRIISSAIGQEKQNSIFGSLKELFSTFPIPSPAIALPIILVVGIVAGYLYPANELASEPEGVQIAELIYNDGGLYE